MAPRKGSYHGPHRQWTAAEDATIRDLYARTGRRQLRATLTTALPHRTWGAIVMRAQTLGAARVGRQWTPEEDHVLRMSWGGMTPKQIVERLPGRRWRGVLKRVAALGIDRFPEGLVPLAEAARKLGYARDTVRRICKAHDVPTVRWWGQRATGPARRGAGRTRDGRVMRWLLVDLTLATIAVEAELARPGETISAGALARNVDPVNLRRALIKQGAYEVGKTGQKLLLPASVLDAAAATLRGAA